MTSDDPNDKDYELINPMDFSSINIHIVMTNNLTQTVVKGEGEIKITEFQDDGLIIESPPKVCAKGHHVLLQVIITGGGATPMNFQSTARVESVKPSKMGDTDQIALSFIQHDQDNWIKVQDLFTKRQTAILDFFKAAKGW